MSITSSITRFKSYYSRHGLLKTIRRTGISLKRSLIASRYVVFYCDLAKVATAPVNIPRSLTVERLSGHSELSPLDLQEMTSFWNPDHAHRNIRTRFDRGASLWLIKADGKLAGYSWTIQGSTIAPYYFLIGENDVQLFDFYMFPQFRGRAILWFLIVQILQRLKAEGAVRVYGDVAEWNKPSLSFYGTTPFHPLGVARSFTILGHRFTHWVEHETVARVQKHAERRDGASTVARSHER